MLCKAYTSNFYPKQMAIGLTPVCGSFSDSVQKVLQHQQARNDDCRNQDPTSLCGPTTSSGFLGCGTTARGWAADTSQLISDAVELGGNVKDGTIADVVVVNEEEVGRPSPCS